jgi:hypothetical protein
MSSFAVGRLTLARFNLKWLTDGQDGLGKKGGRQVGVRQVQC